jgi:DNA repair exonuclease SbcCD ATPase subunit
MSLSAQVQSIQALDDLKGALGRFAGEGQEALQAAEQEIRRTLDWLQERLNHWQNEVRRRQEEVRRAEAALARCQASGYYDREGHYHAPDCSAYERTLRQAQIHLQEADAELRNVQRWTQLVQQAIGKYHAQARRLQDLATVHTEKAQAFLGRAIADLEKYLAVVPSLVSSSGVAPAEQPGVSAPVSKPGITWAEKRAIEERLYSGQPITLEELREDLQRLGQPTSDLQTGTLAEDKSIIYRLRIFDGYDEVLRSSREARNLRGALLAFLKAINYWRSK